MSVNKATVLSVVTGTSLVLAGLGAAAPYAMDDEPQVACEQAGESASCIVNKVAKAEGVFTFDQGVVTDNETIKDSFSKAAAVLCSSLPEYGVEPITGAIAVTGNVVNSFSATIDEMAADEASDSYIMGCACATNGPGGGAMANAEVSGVSLASIAETAQVK